MQLVHVVDTLCFRRQRRNKEEALWTGWAKHSRVGSRTLSRGLQAILSAYQHMSPSRVRYVTLTMSLTSVPYVTRTGNEEYQFGDFTRSAVEGTKVGVEDAVKKVTGNEEYQCNIDSNLKLAAHGVKPQPSPGHPCGPLSERSALGAREQLVTSRRAFSRRPTSP